MTATLNLSQRIDSFLQNGHTIMCSFTTLHLPRINALFLKKYRGEISRPVIKRFLLYIGCEHGGQLPRNQLHSLPSSLTFSCQPLTAPMPRGRLYSLRHIAYPLDQPSDPFSALRRGNPPLQMSDASRYYKNGCPRKTGYKQI